MNSPGGAFEARGEVVRRRWALLAAAGVPIAAAVALARAGAPGWGVLVQEGLAVVLVVAFLSRAFLARRRGVLRADSSGLALDGRRLVGRSRIENAYLASTEEAVMHVDRRRGLSFDAKLESEEDARALLAALGFGVDQSTLSLRAFYGGSPGFTMGMLVAGVGWSLLGALTAQALRERGGAAWMTEVTMPVLLVVLLAMQIRFAARIGIGADGLLLRRIAQRRFISYASLAKVSAARGFLALDLSSGERIRLHLGSRAAAAARRIEEASAAFDQDRINADALIGPAGRSLERWLRDLRERTKARAYRDPQMDPETLWRVLDSASSPPATRAGAALALSATMDDPSRARLRVAADACAEPRLRVALMRVAEGSGDDELEAALAPLLETLR